MKTAHINPGRRGIATYAINIFNYAKKLGVDNLVVSEAKWDKQKINLYEPDSYLFGGVIPWVKRVNDVINKLKEYSPDLLHHHHPCGRLDFYVKKIKNILNVPLICTFHLSVGSREHFIDKVMNTYFKIVRPNFVDSSAYVAVSGAVKKSLIKAGGISSEKIVLIYAGVDPFIFRPGKYIEHETLNVLFVGEIMHEKGLDILIKAVNEASRYRKIKLKIVGDGPLRPLLKKQTKNNNNIEWIGYIGDQNELAKYYRDADVSVLSSRWQEAFPYVILESLSSGTPVIASKVGGTPEVVENNKTGYLFAKESVNELAEILKKVDIQNLWKMGENGRELVLRRHTLDLFGEKYLSLYNNVLNSPDKIKQID